MCLVATMTCFSVDYQIVVRCARPQNVCVTCVCSRLSANRSFERHLLCCRLAEAAAAIQRGLLKYEALCMQVLRFHSPQCDVLCNAPLPFVLVVSMPDIDTKVHIQWDSVAKHFRQTKLLHHGELVGSMPCGVLQCNAVRYAARCLLLHPRCLARPVSARPALALYSCVCLCCSLPLLQV